VSYLRRAEEPSVHYELAGARMQIGREATCEIFLENDLRVSRHHAVCVSDDDGWIIQDDDSANGTFVNGLRTLSYPLRDGDRIKIGDTVLVYVGGADPRDTIPTADDGQSGDERALVTLMFTDIVGSTEAAARLGDAAWRRMLDQHDALTRDEVHRPRGRPIKQTGDGLLACFDSPSRAVRCACAIRTGLAVLDIAVRSGLHTGEVEMRGDDIAGLAVHVAARIAEVAGPGEILVSSILAQLVAGSSLVFAPRGEHELRGVPGTWALNAVTA
jgi:class 3 adenylate cyclase